MQVLFLVIKKANDLTDLLTFRKSGGFENSGYYGILSIE